MPVWRKTDYRAHTCTTEMSPPPGNQKNNLADLEADVRQTPRKPGWPTAYSYFYCEDWSDPLMTNEKKKSQDYGLYLRKRVYIWSNCGKVLFSATCNIIKNYMSRYCIWTLDLGCFFPISSFSEVHKNITSRVYCIYTFEVFLCTRNQQSLRMKLVEKSLSLFKLTS